MVEEEKRRRAPAMTLEQRRAAIVASTLRLLIEHGAALSTSQIAAAAGIAEGTVFRAFKDKRELLVECLRAGMNSEEEVARIDGIDRTLPLAGRLTEAVHAVSGYLDRIWQIGQAVRTEGVGGEHMRQRMHGEEDGQDDTERPDPRKGPPEMQRVNRAVANLFQPGELRLEPEHAGRLLLGLVLTNRMGTTFGARVSEPADVVDLFLHGALGKQSDKHRGEPS